MPPRKRKGPTNASGARPRRTPPTPHAPASPPGPIPADAPALAAADADPATIDWQGFPHIVESIFRCTDWPTRLSFRGTNRYFHSLLDLTRVHVSTRAVTSKQCLIEAHTPSGALVLRVPCDANLRREPELLHTCDPLFHSRRFDDEGVEVRSSFRSFLLDITVCGTCVHRPRIMYQIIDLLSSAPNPWKRDMSLPARAPEAPATARRSARVRARPNPVVRARPNPVPVPAPPEPEREYAFPRERRITLLARDGRVATAPSTLYWAHVRPDDYAAAKSTVHMEWHEDVVVFPITGREPSGPLFNTEILRATVVYDFAGWDADAARRAVDREAEDSPRIRSLVQHAILNMVYGGTVCFSSLDKLELNDVAWLDPMFAKGEGWEMHPAHIGRTDDSKAAQLAAFKRYVSNLIVAHVPEEWHGVDVARIRFLEKGKEWNETLKRGTIRVW